MSAQTSAEDLSHGHYHGHKTNQLGRLQGDNKAVGLFLIAHNCNGTASGIAPRLRPVGGFRQALVPDGGVAWPHE